MAWRAIIFFYSLLLYHNHNARSYTFAHTIAIYLNVRYQNSLFKYVVCMHGMNRRAQKKRNERRRKNTKINECLHHVIYMFTRVYTLHMHIHTRGILWLKDFFRSANEAKKKKRNTLAIVEIWRNNGICGEKGKHF